jgi:hypothetical protein
MYSIAYCVSAVQKLLLPTTAESINVKTILSMAILFFAKARYNDSPHHYEQQFFPRQDIVVAIGA